MRTVVIGAGIIGLSIGWQLSRRGVRVTVVDPTPARGATRAAAGMLAPAAEAWHGEEQLTGLMAWSARRYPGFVAEVERVSGLPSGYRTTQTIVCAADSADRGTLADLHALQERLGLTSEALTLREARRLEPLLAPNLAGAFLMPDDHQIDPRVLSAALLTGVERVVTRPVTAVEHADPDDSTSPVTGVRLADGTGLAADAVVVANALGAAELAGLPVDLGPALRPVYGDILRLAPPTSGWASTLTCTVRGLVNGHPVYAVPRAHSSVVVGATSREDGQPGVSVGGVHELLRDALRIVPALADHGLAETMARPRPGTPDNAPLLGLAAPGLLIATGFFRHGVLLAPLAAAAACHYLVDASSDTAPPGGAPSDTLPDLTSLRPVRFETSTLVKVLT